MPMPSSLIPHTVATATRSPRTPETRGGTRADRLTAGTVAVDTAAAPIRCAMPSPRLRRPPPTARPRQEDAAAGDDQVLAAAQGDPVAGSPPPPPRAGSPARPRPPGRARAGPVHALTASAVTAQLIGLDRMRRVLGRPARVRPASTQSHLDRAPSAGVFAIGVSTGRFDRRSDRLVDKRSARVSDIPVTDTAPHGAGIADAAPSLLTRLMMQSLPAHPSLA